jgi:uncharacterized protein (TIGR02996 family)
MTESHPRLLALLEEARLAPHDNGPRLVLADWLEDHGDGARAELLRLQCLRPRQAAAQERCRALLDRHGGAWLGPLWRWPPRRLDWHRGLLTLRPPALGDHAGALEVLPWVDTVLVAVCCRDGLRDAAGLLAAAGANHASLDLRQPFREAALLAAACRELRLSAPRRQENVRLGTEEASGWSVRLPGLRRPVVFDLRSGLVCYHAQDNAHERFALLMRFVRLVHVVQGRLRYARDASGRQAPPRKEAV